MSSAIQTLRQNSGKAAQYVRMSTDMQKYSTYNQEAVIAIYASTHDLDIVRTYADEGKSGLTIQGRAGLRQLIGDVRSGNAAFDTILVYDISRWGRFQDADESAYYEYVCREAGISVRYCAEEFENDGSLSATLLKTLKRAMAGEFSRELSNRVFVGKCNMVSRGFRHGGRPGYGLRRMVVDEHGNRRGLLENGQQKFLHTDRTILVPGPPDEVQIVRWIFNQFTHQRNGLCEVARDLNSRGIRNAIGNPWTKQTVRDLLSNEKYIGNNVFNRTSVRLKRKRVKNPIDLLVRADGAFEAIIDKETFAKTQVRVHEIGRRYTIFQLLDYLTAVWCLHGQLSTKLLEGLPGCPSSATFTKHFGCVSEAFRQVGYPRLTRRPVYTALRKSILDKIIVQVEASGGTARSVGLRRQTRVLINDEILVTVALAHWSYRTRKAKPRWIFKQYPKFPSDLVVLARFDDGPPAVHDFILFPSVVLKSPLQIILHLNHAEIDSFKSESLEPLSAVFARRCVAPTRVVHHVDAELDPSYRVRVLQCSRSRARNTTARRLLRSFERQSLRIVSFVEKCHSIANRQRTLEAALRRLLSDRSFCKIIFDEKLDSMPSMLADRLSR